jgi:hypothetical protein
MRAKKVYEEIKRGKKPVGSDSPEFIDLLIKKWQNKGLKFGWMFFKGDEVDKKREYLGKYHTYIEKYLNKLHEAGVPWENITFWGDHLDVKSYQLLKGNWSLFHCITEEDAKLVKKVLENMTAGNTPIYIKEDREHINIGDSIYRDSDPQYAKWIKDYEDMKGEKRETDLHFLEHIEEMRNKLKSIL